MKSFHVSLGSVIFLMPPPPTLALSPLLSNREHKKKTHPFVLLCTLFLLRGWSRLYLSVYRICLAFLFVVLSWVWYFNLVCISFSFTFFLVPPFHAWKSRHRFFDIPVVSLVLAFPWLDFATLFLIPMYLYIVWWPEQSVKHCIE